MSYNDQVYKLSCGIKPSNFFLPTCPNFENMFVIGVYYLNKPHNSIL